MALGMGMAWVRVLVAMEVYQMWSMWVLLSTDNCRESGYLGPSG